MAELIRCWVCRRHHYRDEYCTPEDYANPIPLAQVRETFDRIREQAAEEERARA